MSREAAEKWTAEPAAGARTDRPGQSPGPGRLQRGARGPRTDSPGRALVRSQGQSLYRTRGRLRHAGHRVSRRRRPRRHRARDVPRLDLSPRARLPRADRSRHGRSLPFELRPARPARHSRLSGSHAPEPGRRARRCGTRRAGDQRNPGFPRSTPEDVSMTRTGRWLSALAVLLDRPRGLGIATRSLERRPDRALYSKPGSRERASDRALHGLSAARRRRPRRRNAANV